MKPKTYIVLMAVLFLLPFLLIGYTAGKLTKKIWAWHNTDD